MDGPRLENLYEIHTEINNVSFIQSVIILLLFIEDEAVNHLIRVRCSKLFLFLAMYSLVTNKKHYTSSTDKPINQPAVVISCLGFRSLYRTTT
jgi:hypothetical protein